jgi:hypothetical protein
MALTGLHLSASGQSPLALSFSVGPTITPKISYSDCTGHITAATSFSLGMIFRPDSAIGIEVKFISLSNPTSYLKNDKDNTVEAYTRSAIVFDRFLLGFNYYFPLRGIYPFLGIVAGGSHVQTTQTAPQNSITNFNWGLQTGASLKLAKALALRLDACLIFIPNVSDNSTYFGVAADGSGFPSFIIGAPSVAAITQWNINLGIVISLGHPKE